MKLRTKFKNERRYRHETAELGEEREQKKIKAGLVRGTYGGLPNYYPTLSAGDENVMIGM